MTSVLEMRKSTHHAYKLVPPDGGWGYIIVVSMILLNIAGGVPTLIFGLIFDDFLASIGDATAEATLVNGVFNTVQYFTGLVSSYLLQKYSYRKVGLLGATLFSVGATITIFVQNLPQLIISFGILEGLGLGLMLPALFSAYNCYFEKKINIVMCIAQAIMILTNMCTAPIAAYVLEYTGFRGSLVSLAGLTLLNFLAMGMMQPVKWHMKEIKIEQLENNAVDEVGIEKAMSKCEFCKVEKKRAGDKDNSKKSPNCSSVLDFKTKNAVMEINRKCSCVSLGNTIGLSSLAPTNKKSRGACMDVSLLKDPKYINISFGLAVCLISDVTFNSIIPLILQNVNFEKSTAALMMAIFFGADLVSRILISIASALYTIRNRYVFLAGGLLTAVFRTAFTMYDNHTWKMVTLMALGFLRCWIQTPLTLVIAEEYKENFSTAFSLFMVVCGFVSLILGPLTSFVKSATKEDNMVIHVLTIGLLLCSISWLVELLWTRIKGRLFRPKRSFQLGKR